MNEHHAPIDDTDPEHLNGADEEFPQGSMPARSAFAPRLPRVRSPQYPALSLPEAIEKAEILYRKIHHHKVASEALADILEMKAGGSAYARDIAALKKYAIIDQDEEDKDSFGLSERAMDLLSAPQDSPERSKLLQELFHSCQIYSDLWQHYNGKLPHDSVIKSYLVRQRSFNQNKVDGFLRDFHASLACAGLDKVQELSKPSNTPDAVETVTTAPEPAAEAMGSPAPSSNAGYVPPSRPATGASHHTHTSWESGTMEHEPSGDVLPIPVGRGRFATIPYPMSADEFELLVGTINLWKKKLVQEHCGGREHE